MKRQIATRFDLAALLVALMLGGCSEHGEKRQIIGEIKESIRLPKGAHPLSAYSRYYAVRADGTIVAAYVIEQKGFKEQVARACREEIKGTPFPCPTQGGEVRLVEAGQSLWVGDPRDLPFINDGGCAQVSAEYHPKAKRFTHVECNSRL